MKRIKQLYKKEFLQLKRDKRSLAFFSIMPLLWLVLFGYALSTDVKHISLAVYDGDNHYLSRELVTTFVNTEYFDVKYRVFDDNAIKELLDKGKVKTGLIIPPDFSRNCLAGKPAAVQLLIDGSDPNSAGTALNVGNACIKSLAEKTANTQLFVSPIQSQPRIWYNPELRTANFMVPGLIGLILQMLIPMMTVVGIVREREKGTIEQLMTTPIKPFELMLGKILPYLTIAIGVITMVVIAGILLFKVPVKGDVVLFALFTLLFMLVSLSLGLLFSSIAQNQLQAFQMVILVGVPSMLLSGLFFPRESMPTVIYYIGTILPLTYFIELIRNIVLKGVGLSYLWGSILPLLAFETAIVLLSINKFKKKIA